MAPPRFRARLGRQRVTRTTSKAVAAGIGSATKQMKAIEKEYGRWVNHVEMFTPQALMEALQPTFDKSQDYVPVKSGRLKASGFLEMFKTAGGDSGVQIGYGRGGQPPYTIIVHERLDLVHAPPTRAKFLQAALEEDAEQVQRLTLENMKIMSGT